MADTAKSLRETKQAHERRIFVEFCRAAEIPLLLDSIREPAPPEPDIVADIENQGSAGYELVRLNHDDEMLNTNLLIESSTFLASEFAKLGDPQRSTLAAMYGDAHVVLQFSQAANPAQRKQVLSVVWSMLESQPVGVKRLVHNPPIAARASSHLHMIYVARFAGQTEGPQFSAQSASLVYPIQVDRVTEKLQKSYSCAHPLALLAYVDRGEACGIYRRFNKPSHNISRAHSSAKCGCSRSY